MYPKKPKIILEVVAFNLPIKYDGSKIFLNLEVPLLLHGFKCCVIKVVAI